MFETIFGQTHSHENKSKSNSHGDDKKKDDKKKEPAHVHVSGKDFNYGWFDETDPASDMDDFDNLKMKKAIGDHISNKGFGNTRGHPKTTPDKKKQEEKKGNKKHDSGSSKGHGDKDGHKSKQGKQSCCCKPIKHNSISDNHSKVSLECCKYNSTFKEMNHDALEAIKTLKALGGIDGCMLDKLSLEEKKCVCYGTPIGDRLL